MPSSMTWPSIVAPDGVGDPTRPDFRHVARDEAIDVGECVAAADTVLGHRREIEDAGRVADREVFGIRRNTRVCAGPALPRVPLVQRVERGKSRIERRPQPALMDFLYRHLDFSRARIARAALRPGGAADAAARMRAGAAEVQARRAASRYCAAPHTGRTNRNWSSVSSPWCQWPPRDVELTLDIRRRQQLARDDVLREIRRVTFDCPDRIRLEPEPRLLRSSRP